MTTAYDIRFELEYGTPDELVCGCGDGPSRDGCDGHVFTPQAQFVVSPHEFWEVSAARDVIPAAWLAEPARGFTHRVRRRDERSGLYGTPPHDAERTVTVDGATVRIYGDGVRLDVRYAGPDFAGSVETVDAFADLPLTLDAAYALARDPAGVATAEALARETAARHVASGAQPPARVVWRIQAGVAAETAAGPWWDWPAHVALRDLGCRVAEVREHAVVLAREPRGF